jgi:hypothetical protein
MDYSAPPQKNTFASLFTCRHVVAKSTHQIPEIPAIQYLESVNCTFQTHKHFGCQLHISHIFFQYSKIFIYFSQVIQSANNYHSYQEGNYHSTTRPNASRRRTPNGKSQFWLITTHGVEFFNFHSSTDEVSGMRLSIIGYSVAGITRSLR